MKQFSLNKTSSALDSTGSLLIKGYPGQPARYLSRVQTHCQQWGLMMMMTQQGLIPHWLKMMDEFAKMGCDGGGKAGLQQHELQGGRRNRLQLQQVYRLTMKI